MLQYSLNTFCPLVRGYEPPTSMTFRLIPSIERFLMLKPCVGARLVMFSSVMLFNIVVFPVY